MRLYKLKSRYIPLLLAICISTPSFTDTRKESELLLSQTFLENQVNQLTLEDRDTSNTDTTGIDDKDTEKESEPKKKLSRRERRKLAKESKAKEKSKYTKPKKKTIEPTTQVVKESSDSNLTPVSLGNQSTDNTNNNLKEDNEELKRITKEREKNSMKTIDAMNFIQPSLSLSEEEQVKIDNALTRSEQEQLTILWRATLERNKTIRFIVEKLTPDDRNKKKNQVLSQILNTAIFLPFYALQSVTPADTSALASYVGAGLASDLINGKSRKNSDRLQLSQTEMVIMFMMIDQVAERVRDQYHDYKQERVDEALASHELKEAKLEAAAALDIQSPESQFLSQIRIRQIERELRRINLRVRSNRIVLTDLAGNDAVNQVDKLIDKEIAAVIDLPELISASK